MGTLSTRLTRCNQTEPSRTVAPQSSWNAPSPEADSASSPPLHSFGRIPVHPSQSGPGCLPLQRKLTIGSEHDPLESEADAVAASVLSSSIAPAPAQHATPSLQRKCSCSGQQKCDECSKEEEKLQRKASGSVPSMEAPSIVHEELRSSGHPLDDATRAFFEPRFHADLSRVRLHTGPRAAESAHAVHAQAYTVGSDIVFNKGMYAPSTAAGQQLLAHELTHVVQQQGRPSHALRRQAVKPDQKDAKNPAPSSSKSTGGSNIKLFTVRDTRLQLGGTLVKDIEELKKSLMATKDEGEWSLVLAVHGSQERLGAQSPPDWQKNAEFYDASKINSLFEQDKAWVKWRNKYGPTHLSLVACQVSVSFEKTLISNLTRVGSEGRQPAEGLGEGCKPIASTVTLNDAPDSLAKFNQLPQSRQNAIRDQLIKLNEKWGYYGLKPVPNDKVIHYYYEEEPKNAWVTVEVMVGKGHSVDELKATGIPYWNRTFGPDSPKFRDMCSAGVGELHGHTPTAPPDPDE